MPAREFSPSRTTAPFLGFARAPRAGVQSKLGPAAAEIRKLNIEIDLLSDIWASSLKVALLCRSKPQGHCAACSTLNRPGWLVTVRRAKLDSALVTEILESMFVPCSGTQPVSMEHVECYYGDLLAPEPFEGQLQHLLH